MEKAGAGDVGHWGSNLLAGVDHIHTEGVHRITPGTRGRRETERREAFIWGLKVLFVLHNNEVPTDSIPPHDSMCIYAAGK